MIQLILSVALIALILAVPSIGGTQSEIQEHNHVFETTELPLTTNDEQTIYPNEAIGGQWIVKTAPLLDIKIT